MTWQTWAFLVVASVAFGFSGYKFKSLFDLMKKHEGKAPKFSEWPVRIKVAIVQVLGQQAVMRKKWIGTLHAIIFWGFIIITTGTLEQFFTTIHPSLNFQFLGEDAFSALIWVQDLFCGLILFAVFGAGARRWIARPKHLGQSQDANFVLIFTGSLMVSILLMNAFHILGHSPWYAESFIFSKQLVPVLRFFPESSYAALAILFKWIHMLLVMGFAMYIPTSKHLHIVAAGPNTVLKHLSLAKGMKPIRFEDETITQYGAAKVTHLSWKDALDYYSCTECGRCQEVCPAYNTDKPLSPKNLIVDLKKNLYRNKAAILADQKDSVTHVIDENVTEDVIWACTSCRACEVACPVFIEHTDKIYDIRRNLVMMESKFPAEAQPVFKNMETNGSPWAFAASDRANWAQDLSIPTAASVGDLTTLDALLWVGCAGSFDDRNKKVLRSFVQILKKAEIKFAILGNEEQCTGDPARRIGNEYLFQTLAQANVEKLNNYKVKKIITACPHCFNTLKNEYGDFGGHYDVVHHSQYIAQLIKDGRIKPTKEQEQKVTFHDSCYMGRWNGVYEEPRAVVTAAMGHAPVEMKQHHKESMCCGAGGGRMWMEETIGKRINVTRTSQALETGATVIASSCPFCMTMMSDGLKTHEKIGEVQVLDIAELVEKSL